MRFGEYIQRLREAADMSLTYAASELGMSPQRLCDIEQGRRYITKLPTLALLKKIAALYEHPYASLVTNTEFFQAEKGIISDLLANLEPVTSKLESNALAMVVEAKQYTPELEELTKEAHRLTQDLKLCLLLAKTRFAKAPRGPMIESKRSRKAG